MQGKWPLGGVLVVMPVLVAMLLFEALRPFTPFSASDLARMGSAIASDSYPRNVLLYVTFVVVQIFITIGVTGYAVWLIAQADNALRIPGFVLASALTLLVCGGFIIAGKFDLTAYAYTYDIYMTIYGAGDAGGFWTTPIFGGPTAVDLAIIAPSWTGVCAVIFVAIAGQTLIEQHLAQNTIGTKPDRKVVDNVVQILQTLMYGLGAVLICSAIGAGMFFHLPAQLYAATDAASNDATLRQFQLFADDLALFWGTVFTFTFIVAIGAPFAGVYMRVFRRDRDSDGASDLRIFSMSAMFERIGVMFSPMLTAIAAKLFGLFQLGAMVQ